MLQHESERLQFASGGDTRSAHPVRGVVVHHCVPLRERLKNFGEIIQMGGSRRPRKAGALVLRVRPMVMNHGRPSVHVVRPRDCGDS